MSEKLAEVYEQYDMEITNTRKGRGATILTTTDGVRILEPFRGSVVRLEQEYVLKKLFAQEGCTFVDMIIPNKDGELLTSDRYRQSFVLKEHFEGAECDMHNPVDITRTVEALAQLHIYGGRVAERFEQEWENSLREKEEQRIEEIQRAIESGEELERIAQIYGITQVVLEETLQKKMTYLQNEYKDEKKTSGSTANKGIARRKQNRKNTAVRVKDEMEGKDDTEASIADTFERHNKELRKIQKYIGGVKRKKEFENLFLKVFEDYYKQGLWCTKMLGHILGQEMEMGAQQDVTAHYGICHGCFNHHNVIIGEQDVAIVHFERFSRGNQLNDLYQFARKAMEKNHFDHELLELILATYAKKIELTQQDYRYIYVLFAYPEKFWKIANSYYNTNKAFLSPKYLEKLKTVIQQEQEKNDMLSQFFAVHF